MSQPSGTVTFLFTDIQGSTKLWEQFPHAMGTALARHDEILQKAIHASNGHVFKTVGDAFCTAFYTAPEALTAAFKAQLALSSEPWPDDIAINVRMAIHTGSAEIRNTDYFGQPLNRAARLLAVGHGGQVLLSDVARQLCQDLLPAQGGLKSLGDHRLRDLGRPEHVYQFTHPLLKEDFPELNSLESMSSNLPQQLTSFIGRGQELDDLQQLVAKSRLVTLTGSGGCGKTRLALQVAADALDAFEDGVWLVELAPISNPALVVQAVANVTGAKEEQGKPIQESLIEHLGRRSVLVILDNCEHLLDACARLADVLMRRCPNVVILATSREPLGVEGEVTYRVPSLSVPDPSQVSTPTTLPLFDSVRLFIDRASSHLSTFAVTNENAPALASVCHRLDGIPLAIELAAARVRSMSLEEINRRLDQRFSLLTGGSRTNLPRQQTLRSLIDWSYDLLSEPEQRLLPHLSVFWGGWTLESAEGVCAINGVKQSDVLGLMLALVDKSLVVAEERQGVTRYRLLETVREYALERLSDGWERVSDQHLSYFHSLAVEREPDFRGPKQQEWMALLDLEHDNCRAALKWSFEGARNLPLGLGLAAALWRFWYVRGYLAEGFGWLSEVEKPQAATVPLAIQAKALNGAGVMAWIRGDYPHAQSLHEKSLAINRELGDRRGMAVSMSNLGIVVFDLEDFEQAESLYGQAADIFREIDDRYGVASQLNSQGNAAYYAGNLDEACALLEESVALKREIGDSHGIAMSLTNLSVVKRDNGQIESARALVSEAAEFYLDKGDRKGTMACQEQRGFLAMDDGDYGAAIDFFLECLNIAVDSGMLFYTATNLEGLAEVAVRTNQIRRAALLWGYAAKVRDEIAIGLPPPTRKSHEACVAKARKALGDDSAFDAWWQEGRNLTSDQAVSLAKAAS